MHEEIKHNFTSKWITASSIDYGQQDKDYYQSNPHYIFTKKFNITNTTNAVIYIAAFGMYICKINGVRISSDELNSDWTTYSKQLYYDTYQVNEFLKVGENVIEIEVGNGMANPSPMKLFGKYNLRERLDLVGDPQILCEIFIGDDKQFGTDDSWQIAQGNTITNNYYIGEHVDFTNDKLSFKQCVTSNLLADTNLVPSYIEKCKRQFVLKPKAISVNHNNQLVIDFGQTIAGFIDFEFEVLQAKQVEIYYAETKDEEGINYKSAVVGNVGMKVTDFIIDGGLGADPVPYQKDIFELKAGSNKYTNKFTYHSFRYAIIDNLAETEIDRINAIAVYTDVKQTGKIETDNKYLNDLFNAGTNTKLNNIHSVFEDCARERLAYGGDMIALSTSNGYLLNVDKMYRKTIKDFRIEQTSNGGIPETAPYMGIQTNGTGDGEGPILWQLVYPYLTYKHYQLYGDITLLETVYKFISKQLNYLLTYDYEYLATRCLGDHGSPEILGEFHAETPDKIFVGYCTIALFIKTNIQIATSIGIDISELNEQYDNLIAIITNKFSNEDGSFGKKTQTSYAFALELGLGDQSVLAKQLENKLTSDNNIFTAGIFGAAFLYEQLHKLNLDYIVEKWLMQDSDISFKQMLSNQDQVLSELFIAKGTKYYSCNHAMFSSYQSWYFEALSGVTLNKDAVGFNSITINPYFASCVNNLKTSISTKHGEITIEWNRTPTKTIYQASIPAAIEVTIEQKHECNVVQKEINSSYYQLIIEM